MLIPAQQAKGLAELFTGSLAAELPTTRKVIAALPEDKLDFKLGDKGRTARELAWHLATSELWFADGICQGNFGSDAEPEAPATVAAILEWYDRNVPPALEKVKALGGEELSRPINFFNSFNFSAVLYLNFWLVHAVHHRGQLSTYLRAMNARVPSIYGGSADEPFQMPASA
jgi:uncharacterized damage-inducible protein DinB